MNIGEVSPAKVNYTGEIQFDHILKLAPYPLIDSFPKICPVYITNTCWNLLPNGREFVTCEFALGGVIGPGAECFQGFKEALDSYKESITSIELRREIEFYKLMERDVWGKKITYADLDHVESEKIRLEAPCDLEKFRSLFVDLPDGIY